MQKQLLPGFFQAHGGIVRTHQLRAGGFTHYQLNQLLQTGQVVKLKQGLYRWVDSDSSELGDVAASVPKGVYCLFTACHYYELTTFVAGAYHLAIPKKAKVVLPLYPPIQLYYWETTAYELGQTTILVQGLRVLIYDLEKTVCDVLRQRHKIGLDIVKEVVTVYLQRPDRNLARLSQYASQLGLRHYLTTYLTLVV